MRRLTAALIFSCLLPLSGLAFAQPAALSTVEVAAMDTIDPLHEDDNDGTKGCVDTTDPLHEEGNGGTKG